MTEDEQRTGVIKPRDLRIENMVEVDGNIHFVCRIVGNVIGTYQKWGKDFGEIINTTCNELKAVIITDHWLMVFGFVNTADGVWKKYSNNVRGYIDEIEFFNDNDGDCYCTIRQKEISNDREIQSFFIRDIEYVHELQNFYYAWTGRELD